jgi:hypothetical protein
MRYIATFHTHYGALKFQNDCRKAGFPAKTMPVPRKLSSSCGICVEFESSVLWLPEDREDLEAYYLVGEDGGYLPCQIEDGHA